MEAGAVMARSDHATRDRVARIGVAAGKAFQIIDDVLDVRMDGETLGKTPGKDARAGKLTHPAVAGLEASTARAAELIEEAKSELSRLVDRPLLAELLDFIVARTK